MKVSPKIKRLELRLNDIGFDLEWFREHYPEQTKLLIKGKTTLIIVQRPTDENWLPPPWNKSITCHVIFSSERINFNP